MKDLFTNKFYSRSNSTSLRLGNYCFRGLLGLGIVFAQVPIISSTKPALAASSFCATPGIDGVTNTTTVINTYFVGGSPGEAISPGDKNINLPSYNNNGANIPIVPGDLLMIVQMQDATIDSDNDASYGSGNTANDGSGATTIGNSGLYEYVRATNNVPISGGNLEFEGSGINDGLQNRYVNSNPTATQGKRSFQVVRVPQFATLTLEADLNVPEWDGTSGGVLAVDVVGSINFNGFTIEASRKGFRGGFTPAGFSGPGIPDYVVSASADPQDNLAGGKGEGIAGTPRFTWDGTDAIDLGSDLLPGGDAGRGAPGNAGGGGNDHNAGGGGGGNGGKGGLGSIGFEGDGFVRGANNTDNTPGGRGGAIPISPTISRLIMGGGGGGGDANDEENGVRGGQGGGIVSIRAGEFLGSGTVKANGSDGEQGENVNNPDGAGGGGAGGTVALIAERGNLSGITVEAKGGNGGDTQGDDGNPHGPGGGGAGGVVLSYSPSGQVSSAITTGGTRGNTNSGAGIPHGSTDGAGGEATIINPGDFPPISSSSECFPTLEVTKTEANPGQSGERFASNTAEYSITVSNTSDGGAAGVKIKDTLPTGFSYSSGATAVLNGDATGPINPNNSGTATAPIFGDYSIPGGDSVTITFKADIGGNVPVDVYQNPAYATYLDPTRNTPGRAVSPATGASAGDNTTYEGGANPGQAVPGSNYVSSSSTAEDVHITAACPTAKADLWFANDESGSVDSNELDDAIDFLYQISDGFVYDDATGMKAGLMTWADAAPQANPNNIIIPITESFGDPDDSGLISAENISVDLDSQGIREQYDSRQDNSGGTRLDRATNYLASLINDSNNGGRANTPQIAVLLTDAFGSQITANGGGNPWINAANNLKDAGPNGTPIVLILIDAAAAAYTSSNDNPGSVKDIVDTVVGTDGKLLLVPNYSDAADATKGFVKEVAQAICDSTTPVASDPNLLLVKRITAINPGQTDEIVFNNFVEDPADDSDDAANWPDKDTYLRGELNAVDLQPGDEVEYTVYFLSDGDRDVSNLSLCDVIPDNMTFVTNSYGGNSGLTFSNSSTANATVTSLSNAADTDEGTFFAPSAPLPMTGNPPKNLCRKVDTQGTIDETDDVVVEVDADNNVNGAVVLEIDTLPPATSSGTPTNSYGFVRFRARVK